MDSNPWFNQAAGSSSSNNKRDNVDLTLRLGLPNDDISYDVENVNDVPKISYPPILSLSGPNTQGMNKYAIVNERANYGTTGNNLIGNKVEWSPVMGSNTQNLYSANELGLIPGSLSTAAPTYNSSYINLNHNGDNVLPPTVPPTQDYVLLDIPRRRADRENTVGSSSTENRRCTNYNCNTSHTPLWRKGPLGPKTLCNACGLKYRKEKERKRAREAAEGKDTVLPNSSG